MKTKGVIYSLDSYILSTLWSNLFVNVVYRHVIFSVLILCYIGCSTSGDDSISFYESEWLLISAESSDSIYYDYSESIVSMEKFTCIFRESGNFEAAEGCNGCGGSFSLDKNLLTINVTHCTEQLCLSRFEYVPTLRNVTSFEQNKNELTLYSTLNTDSLILKYRVVDGQ